MTVTVPTRQLLDPAGIVGAYPTAVALAIIAFAAGLAASVRALLDGPVWFPVTALVFFAGACAVVVLAARPRRAPFTARSHFLVYLLSLTAAGFSTAATWGAGGSFLEHNWVAIGLGILAIAVAPYRPMRELVGAGTVAAAFVAVVELVEAEATISGVPPISLAVASALAILALCYGNATYSASTIRSLERARRRADDASDALAEELRDGIALSVQESRATILSRDVVPFLAELLTRPELTDSDRRRAREIAESIRKVMVEEADRSWLEAFFVSDGSSERRRVRVVDRSHLAPEIETGQRTALRALLVAIGEDRRVGDVDITLFPAGGFGAGVIRITVDPPDAARARYAAFLSVIRVAFAASSVDIDHSDLIVRFTFERHRRIDETHPARDPRRPRDAGGQHDGVDRR